MSCILSIVGEDLDVDGFIQKSNLEPYKKFYKGDPRIKSKPDGKKHSFSGLSIKNEQCRLQPIRCPNQRYYYLHKSKQRKASAHSNNQRSWPRYAGLWYWATDRLWEDCLSVWPFSIWIITSCRRTGYGFRSFLVSSSKWRIEKRA